MTSVPAIGLEVGIDYDGGCVVLALAGEIDVYSAPVLRENLMALGAAGHHRIALDLGSMAFCDSTGLGLLVGAVKRATAGGGGLAVFSPPEHFMKVLRITGLSKVLAAFEERTEALGWLAAQ